MAKTYLGRLTEKEKSQLNRDLMCGFEDNDSSSAGGGDGDWCEVAIPEVLSVSKEEQDGRWGTLSLFTPLIFIIFFKYINLLKNKILTIIYTQITVI